MPMLKEWENFYVIVGSSAAALTGLQFVTMALVADIDAPATALAIDAFGTPNVAHFSAVLLVSALLTAPWRSALALAVLLGVVGVSGIVYVIIVARRARRQSEYRPVLEDWMFHVLLPAVAYVLVTVAAALLRSRDAEALFVLGTGVLVLLFAGIHNAWDTVTYMVVDQRHGKKKQ